MDIQRLWAKNDYKQYMNTTVGIPREPLLFKDITHTPKSRYDYTVGFIRRHI